MKLIKPSTFLAISMGVLATTSIGAFGSTNTVSAAPMPLIQEPQTPKPQQMPPVQPDQSTPAAAHNSTFSGAIAKEGNSYVLRDVSGGEYKLDDASRAQSFEGKTVKVTGKLDTDSKTIHVDSIEGAS